MNLLYGLGTGTWLNVNSNLSSSAVECCQWKHPAGNVGGGLATTLEQGQMMLLDKQVPTQSSSTLLMTSRSEHLQQNIDNAVYENVGAGDHCL